MTQSKQISFQVTADDARVIQMIVDRAVKLGLHPNHRALDLRMDITATHANGCRLRLPELLASAPFDFTHDVCGIRRHIDRSTGKLTDCFFPRFGES